MKFFGDSVEVYLIQIAIAIPVFLLLNWLRKRYIRKPIGKLLPWIGTIVIIPILFRGVVFLWLAYVSYYPQRDFERQAWMEFPSERYMMMNDLIESDRLFGKTKTEVLALLGDMSGDYQNDVWSYYIGFVPGPFSVDPSSIDIYFEEGKVVKVSHHSH